MKEKSILKKITLNKNENINILKLLQHGNVYVEASCSGNGKCGKCKVKLLSGEVTEISELEKRILTKDEINDNIILACMRKPLSEIIIELEDEKDYTKGKGYIKKNSKNINPIITKKYNILSKPTLDDPASDVERVLREYNENTQIDISIISEITKILKESDYKITTTIIDNEIVKIEKGNTVSKNYAIALDIGTTTVAAYLLDLNCAKTISSKAHSNLQKKYGLDVISRINYAMQSNENLNDLQKLVIETVDIIIGELLEVENVEKEDVSMVSVVGNTTMSHIFLGLTVDGISRSPFTPVFTKSIKFSAKNVNIKSLPGNTRFILLPNIAGYVGSDTIAVAISTDIANREGNWLALDIGTNCELILKTKERILTCSTAAGPAFEGTNMSCGMRAEPGSVYSISLTDDINSKTIDNKEAIGICGSGYIEIVAQLLKSNIIKRQGRIRNNEELEEVIPNRVLKRIEKSDKGKRIVIDNKGKVFINQEDISNLQLAKAAVKAGIDIMLKEGNIQKLDGILLAGAFGSSIDIESLKIIGMIPNIDIEKFEIVGNAAGSGAIDIILYKEVYDNIMILQNNIEHIELASHNDFQEMFIKSMMFNTIKGGLACATQ